MAALPLPPPYLGQKDDLPLAVIENPYCERAWNYNLDTGVPTIRQGDFAWYRGGTSVEKSLHLATYFNSSSVSQMFVVYQLGTDIIFADVTTFSTRTAVLTLGPVVGTPAYITSLLFNNYLFFMGDYPLNSGLGGSVGMQQNNNGTWGTAGYTFTGGAGQTPFGGAVYKNRAYFLLKNSGNPVRPTYSYTEIDAIAGATTNVYLNSVISTPANLYIIRAVGLSEGIQQEAVLAFIFSSGEVLVYNGTYPNSSTWGLIGQFAVPRPVYYNAYVDAKGDSFIITEGGLVSLRTLFTNGAEVALREGLSKNIGNRWRQIFTYYLDNSTYNLYVRGLYDPKNDRIIICFPHYVDLTGAVDTTKALRLIYSFETNSWSEAIITVPTGKGSTSLAFFGSSCFYGSAGYGGIMAIEGASASYVDAQVDGATSTGIAYNLRTAPLPTGKFGVNRLTGVELISKTDLHAQTDYKLISNLGQTTTSAQKLPSQGTGVANPMVDVGTVGNYIQLDISGTTTSSSTIGQSIYAMNAWVSPGPEGSR